MPASPTAPATDAASSAAPTTDEDSLTLPDHWSAHLDARPGGRLSLERVLQIFEDPYAGSSSDFAQAFRDRLDIPYTLVAAGGAGALPGLEDMAPIASWVDPGEQRAVAEAMSVIPTDAAFEALLLRATQSLEAGGAWGDQAARNERYFGEALREAMARFPRRAVRLLAPRAVGRTIAADRFRSILEPHVRRRRDAARDVAPMLDAEPRALVYGLLEAAEVAVAAPEALPGALRDPWGKKKPPKMPAFWDAAAMPPPELRGGQGALPFAAVQALGELLSKGKPRAPHPGVAEAKAACTQASIDRFAWSLFEAWMRAGASPKDKWAFLQLGWLGDDEIAHRLVARIKEWPRQGAAKRAELGLDVLAEMDSDVALMLVHQLSQKASSKSLRRNAGKKIATIALERGLGADELADRLVPDFGLDADGSTWLDFGPRRFRVGFDATLQPYVRDEQGARRAGLPKPGKSDDPDLAAAADARFKALKKGVRALASSQLRRLEDAMRRQRRWTLDEHRDLLVRHPLLGHVVRGLIWAAYDDGSMVASFRVAEDGSFAGLDDEPVAFEGDVEIGIAHALELSPEARAIWGERLSDYEQLAPFSQLARETFVATPARPRSAMIADVTSADVEAVRVVGLESRGWMRGAVGDGGIWDTMMLGAVSLRLDPGVGVYGIAEAPPQQIEVQLWEGDLDGLSAVTFSELMRDLQSLRG
ncbi:MAG: DUF4132 domain-containing protein [Myxococcales bacterium]|nr:DUF4132 domain-containing protein [Myxococcales bacterium]